MITSLCFCNVSCFLIWIISSSASSVAIIYIGLSNDLQNSWYSNANKFSLRKKKEFYLKNALIVINYSVFWHSVLIASHRLLGDLIRAEAEPVFPRPYIFSFSPSYIAASYCHLPLKGISNSKLFMWLSKFFNLQRLSEYYFQCWQCNTSNAPRICVHVFNCSLRLRLRVGK